MTRTDLIVYAAVGGTATLVLYVCLTLGYEHFTRLDDSNPLFRGCREKQSAEWCATEIRRMFPRDPLTDLLGQ
jgi:hypothetical protein